MDLWRKGVGKAPEDIYRREHEKKRINSDLPI